MINLDLTPVANHLWQSTLCTATVWVLTLALRKNCAAVRYWLWLAASVKFLVPFAVLVNIGGQLHWGSTSVTAPPQFSVVISQFGRPFQALVPAATHAAVARTANLLPSILCCVWLCGAVLGLIVWWRSLRRMQAIQRAAAPLPFDFAIPVMSSPAGLEPGVFGIWKPVLLLPAGISERLTPAQLKAVLAHELCHVRRRDNLTGAIHMLVEIIFWFHPLVWLIRLRLVAERERACDEEVLRVWDASVYAEGILNVCKFCLESPPLFVAGVTGSNLKKRIEEILAHRPARSIRAFERLLLAAMGLGALVAPVIMGAFGAQPIRAQSQPAERLAFAAASIRESKSLDKSGMNFQFLPGGRFVARGVPLSIIVATAYDVPFQSGRLTGVPDWMYRTAFDIEATPEEGTIPPGASRKVRDDKIRGMLQTLFADRLKMTVRREVREMPVYAVDVRKGGPKLQKSVINEGACAGQPTTLGDGRSCHSLEGGQGRGVEGDAVTISDLASWVSNWADRPVIDKTGLPELYKIQTDGWVPMRPRPPRPPGQEPSAEDLAFADPTRPTLFQIFDRLGLKLESQTAPVEILVIEHVERPSEN